MRFGEVEFLARRALQQFDRMPAADAGEAIRRQRRFQRGGLTRKFVAELHALEARLLGLGEAGLERRLAADLLADRRSTSRSDWRLDGSSFQSPTRWAASAFS